jgi:hypothetical protein
VLIVEGEKTFDAAKDLLPEFICCCWSGGCKAIGKTDFSPLKGRHVVLWPDNDEPGLDAMQRLAQTLHDIGASNIRLVENPPEKPTGWDLADATDWSAADALQWLDGHAETVAVEPRPNPSEANFSDPIKLNTAQDKPPASMQALIQRLPDGWIEKTTKDGEMVLAARALSPGRLSELLPAQSFRFNELDLRAYVKTSSGWQCINDAELDSAYVLLTGKGWRVGSDAVVKAILHVARQAPVHPVREYLQRVKADLSIVPYDLDQVAPELFRASHPLHVAMVRKWLIGAVARILEPGCQMDYCLVLKGAQGLLKTTSLKALAGREWFTSTHAHNDKDFLQNVNGCWVYELAELETITGTRQSGALKNLITSATDSFRPPYGRTPERTDRQSVFCATVNKDEFLRDETGNRRFWVVPIEGNQQLNREAITAARDAIWKAAVLAYEAGELPMLTKELETLSADQNEQFNEQDPWIGMVRAWMNGTPMRRFDPSDPPPTLFRPAGSFSSAEILYSAGLRSPNAYGRADEMRLSAVLRGFCFESKQTRVDGQRVRLWSLTQPTQPVSTSAAEVESPEICSSAMDLSVLTQPTQPLSSNRGNEKRGGGGGDARVITPKSGDLGRVGRVSRQIACSAMDLSDSTSTAEVESVESGRVSHAVAGGVAQVPGFSDLSAPPVGSAWDL